jgi:hypothetical protein
VSPRAAVRAEHGEKVTPDCLDLIAQRLLENDVCRPCVILGDPYLKVLSSRCEGLTRRSSPLTVSSGAQKWGWSTTYLGRC